MYYRIRPSEKVAQKLVDAFIKELYELKRKPKWDRADRKNLRRIREAAKLMEKRV